MLANKSSHIHSTKPLFFLPTLLCEHCWVWRACRTRQATNHIPVRPTNPGLGHGITGIHHTVRNHRHVCTTQHSTHHSRGRPVCAVPRPVECHSAALLTQHSTAQHSTAHAVHQQRAARCSDQAARAQHTVPQQASSRGGTTTHTRTIIGSTPPLCSNQPKPSNG